MIIFFTIIDRFSRDQLGQPDIRVNGLKSIIRIRLKSFVDFYQHLPYCYFFFVKS